MILIAPKSDYNFHSIVYNLIKSIKTGPAALMLAKAIFLELILKHSLWPKSKPK